MSTRTIEELKDAVTNVTAQTNAPFSIVERGTVEIKGKGMMNTYWLESRT